MMEILFRGKTTLDNEWVIGAGVYKSEGHTWIITDDVTKTENRGTGSDEINPETVGQYTGLTDKDGTKIFEGDIVKAEINGGPYDNFVFPVGVIAFENGCFGNKDRKQFTSLSSYAPRVGFEVIGNIHDNPELLRTPQNDEVRE